MLPSPARSPAAQKDLFAVTISPETTGYLVAERMRDVMSQRLKTDLALFAAAFIASAFVLGADTSFAHMLGAVLSAR